MKSKIFLFAIIFVSSFFVADDSFAGSGACDKNFWSKKCQKFIHQRDHKNNIKQLPKRQRAEFKKCAGSKSSRNFGSGNKCKTVLKYPNLIYDY